MGRTLPESHIYGIDIVRFLCAISVAIFHYSWRSPFGGGIPWGWIGVEIFFVISGLVISASARSTTATQFLIGRFLRLYPAAWICVTISVAVFALTVFLLRLPFEIYQVIGITVSPRARDIIGSLILFPSLRIASSYWTLVAEIAFYIFIFIFILFDVPDKIRKAALILTVIGIPFCALRLVDASGTHISWIDLGYGVKNALLVRHGPYFALGMYIYLITIEKKYNKIDVVALSLAIILSVIEICMRARGIFPLYNMSNFPDLTLEKLSITASSIFCVAIAFLFFTTKFNHLIIIGRNYQVILRYMGLMTYPFYLLHEATGTVPLYILLQQGVNVYLGIAIALVCVGTLSFVVVKWEAHLRAYLRRLIRQVQSRKEAVQTPEP